MFTEEMVFDAGDQKLAGTMIFADHGRRPSIAHLHGLVYREPAQRPVSA